MTRTASTWLALVAVSALVMAGCGDKADDDSPVPRLGQAEFTRQVDAVCADLKRSAAKIPTDTLADLRAAGPKEEEGLLDAIDDLREIAPPEALDADYSSFIDALEAQHVAFQKVVAAAQAGEPAGVRAAGVEFERKRQTRGKIADRLGLNDCQAD